MTDDDRVWQLASLRADYDAIDLHPLQWEALWSKCDAQRKELHALNVAIRERDRLTDERIADLVKERDALKAERDALLPYGDVRLTAERDAGYQACRERERAPRNISFALGLVAAIKLGEQVESRVDRGDAWGDRGETWGDVGEYYLRHVGLWREDSVDGHQGDGDD